MEHGHDPNMNLFRKWDSTALKWTDARRVVPATANQDGSMMSFLLNPSPRVSSIVLL